MVDRKQIMQDLDKVGQLIDQTSKTGGKLSAAQVSQAKRTLGAAVAELFRIKAANLKQQQALMAKKTAIKKSASEKLITQADAQTELKSAFSSSVTVRTAARNIQAAIDQTKKLAAEVNKLAASPELEKLEKGHASSEAIKPPQKASASVHQTIKARIQARLNKQAEQNPPVKHDEGTVPVDRPPQKGMAPGMPPQFPQAGNVEELEMGAPKGSTTQAPGVNEGAPAVSPTTAGRQARAKSMYTRAMQLTRRAAAEKPEVRTKTLRMASSLEKMADRLMAAKTPVTKTAAQIVHKTATKVEMPKQASTTVFAAAERVLLADGSIGVISAVNGEVLKVSVAGVEKDVLATTVKRIVSIKKDAEKDVSVKADEKTVTIKLPTDMVEKAVDKVEDKAENKAEKSEAPKAPKAEKPDAPEAPEVPKADKPPEMKGASIADRIKNAISIVRGSKKTAAEEPKAPEMPKETKPEAKAAPAAEGTVGKSFTTTYAPAPNGKFNVQISETEIVECDTEPEAQALVARSSKVVATAQTPDSPTDSATTKKPDAMADVSKTLKGLDQSGKDYGTTSKDEKVDPQFSMVKKSTALTKDSPTDSATTRRPDAMADVSKTLKGLDQAGKGYGSTSKDEQVDPQFSMIKKSQLKEKILADSNRKMAERLSVTEAALLADRAVKVGAVTEEQRTEQQTVLAELYRESPAEFKAYSRLIASLETNKAQTPTLASRTVNKVQAALSRRHGEVIDASAPTVVSASLEAGTFFEDEAN